MAEKRRTPARAVYYNALKAAGVQFDRHYRDYAVDELKTAYEALVEQGVVQPLADVPPDPVPRPRKEPSPLPLTPPPSTPPVETGTTASLPPHETEDSSITKELAELKKIVLLLAEQQVRQQRGTEKMSEPTPPVMEQETARALPPLPSHLPNPEQHAGVTLNTQAADEPIRIDEQGIAWYQNEVAKPAYPKPRGRRVLRDLDPGVVQESIKVGDYIETFEVPGDPANAKPVEIKITLPSYQTGVYKAPGMPFKIHTYNGLRAFDFDDVNNYYGGSDLVPDTIKRCYVSSDLCYDITTTVRAIQDEYRERVLRTGAI